MLLTAVNGRPSPPVARLNGSWSARERQPDPPLMILAERHLDTNQIAIRFIARRSRTWQRRDPPASR